MFHNGVFTQLLQGHTLKQGVPFEMGAHPVMQLQHVSYGIHQPPDSKHVGILCQQRGTDDSPLVLRPLEMWVREEEEHLRQLALAEEVGKVFHGIATETSNVLEATSRSGSKGPNPVLYVV